MQGYVEEHPYVFPWNTNLVESGNYYSLHANVKDINNNTTTLAPLSIFVDNGISSDISPPTGAIVSPPAGITLSGNVNIIVSANDDRAMEQVALSINGEYITSIETAPYFYIWDTTLEEEDSEHIISVVLVDLAGNESPLNPISVFVDNYPDSDTQAPTVVIMEPSAGQIIAGDIDIEVTANDDTGIDYIQFWINGEVAVQDSIAPYSYSWDTRFMSEDMEHIIAVAAFDFQGNSTLATPIAVYVDNIDNILPSGNIQSPVAGQTVLGTIPISIFATDNHRVEFIELSSNSDQARTGDVVQLKAEAYNKKGQVLSNIPFEFSFKGKSFDKSNTASGLIINDGRFVADVSGNYLVTASLGNVSVSKALNIYERNVKRDVVKVGTGLVNDKHTSDFWVFEGSDGGDYAGTGTWGADGKAYFWDVSNPSDLKKIDSVQVDARTVNDVKVSQDSKICVISREGASDRKNGIILIDVTNPRDVKIITEYTKNLTGGVHNVFIDNNHIYALSNGERFYVINIDDPKNPYEVGMFEIGKDT